MSYIRALAVGTSPLYGWALVHPLYVIHPSFGGGSKPPPYEGTLIAQVSTPRAVFDRQVSTKIMGRLRWEQAPTVRMGFSPSALLA